MKHLLHRLIRTGLLLFASIAALVIAFWAWKREVAFARDHWRFEHHVAGTDLARFPLVEPRGTPLYRQKIDSGFMPWVSLTYTSRASFLDVMRGIGMACPTERWVGMTEAELRHAAETWTAFSCRRVLFDVVSRDDGEHVFAFLTD